MSSAQRRVVRVLSLVGMLAGLIVTTSTTLPVAAATGGSAYTSQVPNRILDTRLSAQTLGTNASLNLTVAGGTTGVPAGATGVVLNVTVANTSTAGALTVYPAGGTRPVASNLNWAAGEIRPNLVNVPVGTAGQVTIYNFVGNTDVVVDEEGYFSAPSGTAGGYNSLSPARLLDTRLSAQTMSTGSTIDLQVTGAGGVPAGGVSAVVLNATATNTATQGFFTLYPQGATRPLASNVNWAAGWTVPNRVIVKVGPTGKVTIYNGQGAADAVIDVSGYFTDSTASGKLFTPIFPIRVLDTRISGGTLGPNGTYNNFQVTGTFTVPPGATAAFLNVTVTNTSASSALTVYPNARPLASDLNWVAGQTIPNLTLATLSSSGSTNFYNFVGSTDLVVDLSGYFGSTPGVAVSANPASIPADGATTSTVTATVTNTNGTPALNDPVNFTKSGSPAAACGVFTTANPNNTNASGNSSITYQASATAGTCTITATEAQGGLSGTVTITQTKVPNTIVVTATPQTVPADGATTSAIVSTVTPAVAGDVVSYTTSGNPAAACGTLSAASATTNAGGVTPAVTYTASLTVGFCTLTATEAGTGSTGKVVILQQGTAVGDATTVAANPTGPFPADGAKTSVITATVTGPGHAADLVSFTMAGAAGVCGTLSTASGTTGAPGTVSTTYTVSTTAGTCTITATEANGGTSNSVAIVQTGVPNNIALTATPSSVPADGTTTSTLKAVVTKGVGGAVVAGVLVTFVETGAVCGPLSSATATTDASGSASVTYTASVTTGFCSITATDTSGGTSNAVTITQTSAAASAVAVTANPTSIPADHTTTSTVTAAVTTSGGGPVPNDSVNFTTSGGSACGTFTTANPTMTNGAGKATVTYLSSTTTGTCTVTATEASLGKTGSATITQTVVVNVITVSASANPIAADGAATSNITSHVTNLGNPVGADVVTYTMSANPAGACGTLATATSTTAASGTTPADVYTASLVVGFCTITGTEAGTGQAATVTITQKGTATNAITVGVSPASVPADGTTTSTVTATVTGTGHGADLVSFTLTPSVAGACGTLSASSATTPASGVVSVTYTASTTVGSCVVNVAEANGGSNNAAQAAGTKTITQTAVPHNISETANPSSIKGDGITTSVVTATVTKGTGGALAADTVNFTLVGGNCGTLSAASAVTDASGHATVTYTSKLAPATFCTVHAVETGTSQAADVIITQTT